MNPREAEVGQMYMITLTDSTLQYRVLVDEVRKHGIHGTYVPFHGIPGIELPGMFRFKDILSMEEI